MIRVLVTGAGGGVGQGIIKSLRLIQDMHIDILAADMSPLASGLYGGDKAVLVPAASSSDYFDVIQKICFQNRIDIYFPGTDVELLKASECSDNLYKLCGTTTAVCPKQVIEIADDKYLTFKFLNENGFSAPFTSFPSTQVLSILDYPAIVKPRVGCRSIGVYKVVNKVEAIRVIESLEDPLIQQYIDGFEYTCTIVKVNNRISDVLCLRRDLRDGDTFRAFPEQNKIIEDYVRAIALKLDIFGSCNFQLRVENGVPKLFEINSRFSGTTPFCAQLGFNPVEFFLKALFCQDFKSNINYDAVVLRHWNEVVVSKSSLDVSDYAVPFEVDVLATSSMIK